MPKLSLLFVILCVIQFGVNYTVIAQEKPKPNIILIMCDDLNDYVKGFGGHPQTQTPNFERLAKTGVSFQQAHCNIPICGPSRASMFTGIYPHNSGCFGFTRWNQYEVLKNSRTMMDHFRANGYKTLGTGKLMHFELQREWNEFGNASDYGPFAFDGTDRVAHPDVKSPYREIGNIDGSFGPLVNLENRPPANGKSFRWQTGNWKKMRDLRVTSPEDRGKTADELNGEWAVEKLNALIQSKDGKPFFMGVGFIRPHTPLIVPQKFFDQFPLDKIRLPEIKSGDVKDTFAHTVRGNPNSKEPDSQRTNDMGSRLFDALMASYPKEEGLKRFIQAYLASVASVDDQLGKIIDVIDNSELAKNTIIIVTSDHGWTMGQKDYLYKNSLWQESTRVPLIIRAPSFSKHFGKSVDQPVSLIDIYPTLIDLCGVSNNTVKNSLGHSLDGFSLKPLLQDKSAKWAGPESALTALYKWKRSYNPSKQSYSLRAKDWRYIRYENGKEELYRTVDDPNEWNNLADDKKYETELKSFRQQLANRIPSATDKVPNQPVKPTNGNKAGKANKSKTSNPKDSTKKDAEYWKAQFFKRHPEADVNRDGKLSWPEHKAHKKKLELRKNKQDK